MPCPATRTTHHKLNSSTMQLPKNNFQVKYHSDGDGGGHWEMVNEKGDGLKTTGDSDEIAHQFQVVADILNRMEDEVRVETSLELTLHCNEQLAKMERDHWKECSQKLANALEAVFRPGELTMDGLIPTKQVADLRKALNEYNEQP